MTSRIASLKTRLTISSFSSSQMATIPLATASEAATTSAHCVHTKATTTTDATASQQREASKRFISETGMGRLIIKT